jgi:hypothetical protein
VIRIIPDVSVLCRNPNCRTPRGRLAPRFFRLAPRFLACLVALFFLMPSFLTPVFLTPCFAASAVPADDDGLPIGKIDPRIQRKPIRTSDSTDPAGSNVAAQQGPGRSGNAAPKSEAAEAWDAVKDTTKPALLKAFIKRYGTSFFAELAKARLDDLEAMAPKISPQISPKSSPSATTVQTQRIDRGQQLPADGTRSRAVLYDEDPSSPAGQQYPGSVTWRTEVVKADGKPDEVSARAEIDVPSRGLRMTMSMARNLDSALPASHVIELTFDLAADFAGGGITSVPGMLMKSSEQARGTPLAGLTVKVTRGSFLVGLSNVALECDRNLKLLLERSWIDIPIVYDNKRRAILAIEKGESGDKVFETAFTAWGQSPAAAPAIPDGGNGGQR